ncbi:efflux RND transporter periplasmic adaptor subunit [Fulvivirga sp. 29W222]|uniref:Efflux RND transporter periplasmic adaptor subunit n=1 Tax=Fulvivirga marina TaxID=2494733 RepID=A0A937KFR3_9BACT|nr:efflux RND transporter periplasmic adaptor subunit [Fulvivirga marina]MBL6448443.1 efflux RND transporter periplasmic adaptor subunit [Fulvivirga marina]
MPIKTIFNAVLIVLISSCNNNGEKVKPLTGTITESVYASITVQPDSLYNAHAAVGGIVAEVYVEEGASLEKGARVMQITNDAPELNTEKARLAVELARENLKGNAALLKELKEDIEVARLKLKQDSIHYFRQKKLWKQNVGTQNDYDAKKTAYEISQKNLQALGNRYNRTRNELETQLEQAEVNHQTSLIASRDYTVKSELRGKVYSIYKEPGELVSLQEPIASIGSANNFIIEMLIDEVDIARVEVGQQVLITLDAYEGEVFSAALTKIYPQKNVRTQTFTAEAKFKEVPGKLYPGLSGEANIIISQKEDAVIIPRNYLIGENQVKTSEGMVEIKTGLYSMDKIEVLDGLDTSTYIYKP